jgi:hypothetical protein
MGKSLDAEWIGFRMGIGRDLGKKKYEISLEVEPGTFSVAHHCTDGLLRLCK